MNNYVELEEQVKLISQKPCSFVDENYILRAQYFIHRCSIANKDDAFLVFASHNYLNFATKQDGYKKLVGYYFKRKLSEPIRKCLDSKLDIHFLLSKDKGMQILYVDFDGFIFSFHNPTLDEDLIDKLNDQVQFDYIYKQKAADFIFKVAMKSDILTLDLSRLAKSSHEE